MRPTAAINFVLQERDQWSLRIRILSEKFEGARSQLRPACLSRISNVQKNGITLPNNELDVVLISTSSSRPATSIRNYSECEY